MSDIHAEISRNRNLVKHENIRWPVEYIMDQFVKGNLIIPHFQREFRWPEEKQSKFIESLLLGLPIPSIFIARNKNGELEIIDGSQRIRTIVSFCANRKTLKELRTPLAKLKLSHIDKLIEMNGYCFEDLPKEDQNFILSSGIGANVLSDELNNKTKIWMFERINSKSADLTAMEKRIGIYDGEFISNLMDICNNQVITEALNYKSTKKFNKTKEELVLRYFGYMDYFKGFLSGHIKYGSSVEDFLNDYLNLKKDDSIKDTEKKLLLDTFMFIKNNFPNGFNKNIPGKAKRGIPNGRFEALSVGTGLAISEKGIDNLDISSIKERIYSTEFLDIFGSGSLNNKNKLNDRILYVKNKLTGNDYRLQGSY